MLLIFLKMANGKNTDRIGYGEEYPATMGGRTCLQNNRCKGIHIGCYNEEIDRLKYPLKLVSASYKGTYEECKGKSYVDPEQGFYKTYW